MEVDFFLKGCFICLDGNLLDEYCIFGTLCLRDCVHGIMRLYRTGGLLDFLVAKSDSCDLRNCDCSTKISTGLYFPKRSMLNIWHPRMGSQIDSYERGRDALPLTPSRLDNNVHRFYIISIAPWLSRVPPPDQPTPSTS